MIPASFVLLLSLVQRKEVVRHKPRAVTNVLLQVLGQGCTPRSPPLHHRYRPGGCALFGCLPADVNECRTHETSLPAARHAQQPSQAHTGCFWRRRPLLLAAICAKAEATTTSLEHRNRGQATVHWKRSRPPTPQVDLWRKSQRAQLHNKSHHKHAASCV